MAAIEDFPAKVPRHFLTLPPLQDDLTTPTSDAQDETLQECMPLLRAAGDPTRNPFDFNEFGMPELRREDHVDFLHENLSRFPSAFVGLDASRPWLVYWGLMGLYLLGEDVTPRRRQVISTFFPLQNLSGGFGGGHGHKSHLATTYGALLSIALVGGEQVFRLIDRKAMWHWLGRLKQAGGGFRITEGGEEDTRGAYCALVIISLLSLPIELPPDSPARHAGLKTFNDRLGTYISRCQTYEGGIAGTPGNEAHGAYVFCAIGCLCLLGPPHETLRKYLDLDNLVCWLSTRQYAPEGGIAGRTNKLVDGCYSHWIGDVWPIVQAAMNGPMSVDDYDGKPNVGDLYSAEGLARYIICCCQAQPGGLRDKPSKRPDSYHTCYTLSGLSTTEYFHCYSSTGEENQFASAWSWRAVKKQPRQDPEVAMFEDGTHVNPMHPVFAIPHGCMAEIREWSEKQPW